MQIKNTVFSYGLVSKILHWLTALLIFTLLAVGFYMEGLAYDENKLQIIGLHKSFGLLVLLLAFVRVIWHILSHRPRALATHQRWEKFLSHLIHGFLYFALFALPISGWVMSSAGDFNVQFFGIQMPDLVAKDKTVFMNAREAHEIIAFLLIGALGLHMAGAFKHHFIDKDQTLERITRENLGSVRSVFLVIAAIMLMTPTLYFIGKEIVSEFSENEDAHQTTEEVTAQTIENATPAVPKEGWIIDTANSHIQFQATQSGQTFEGAFKVFDGTIIFDPENLSGSKASISIDINSIETGSDDRDSQAKGAEWFDTQKFPNAVFETKSFQKTGENQYAADSILTIRDVALPLSLPFSLTIEKDAAGKASAQMQAEIDLERLSFGIGQGAWKSTDTIGNTVKIKIKIQAHLE